MNIELSTSEIGIILECLSETKRHYEDTFYNYELEEDDFYQDLRNVYCRLQKKQFDNLKIKYVSQNESKSK